MQGGILGVDAQIDVLRIFFVCPKTHNACISGESRCRFGGEKKIAIDSH